MKYILIIGISALAVYEIGSLILSIKNKIKTSKKPVKEDEEEEDGKEIKEE